MTIPHSSERKIDSPTNSVVRLARALERDRASRSRRRLHLAWGLHLAQEALAADATIDRALIGPRLARTGEGEETLRRLRAMNVPILHLPTRLLESIGAGIGDQGVLLILRRTECDLDSLLGGSPTLLLLSHGVQDPGNLGSMIRTARAFAADGIVVLEGCADPFSSRAVRASMGALFRTKVVSSTVDASIAAIHAAGLQLVAADPNGDDRPPDVDMTRPTAICVGSEGSGLPVRIIGEAAHRVSVPMAPGVSSLNVHAAAATLLYESARQRRFNLEP